MSHLETHASPDTPTTPTETYPYLDYVRQDILRMIPDDGMKIGSVGCGRAVTEAILVGKGREVHGVDVSEEAIEVAKRRLTSARVIAPDDRRPFEDDSLDGLILADVIEHIPAAWDALASYVRAVRPGGWVVISVPNMRSLNVIAQFIILGDWPEKSMGIFDATHIQNMSRRRLERWCKNADLSFEKWFDKYESHSWRGRWIKGLDTITFRLFHDILSFQLQCRCRKQS
ncbi:MAG: class I SAM-dependent methyltransferase [Paludisphaera borealis]|uniref:class I SAM-dependent methyltransferase n=1 Tax=Paludisphaera borealis TaxID=1387353 RepID=UPI00284DFB86|nr:class I SAM-dependent methyltransferase [Paludisphaera borealis]MDR3620712.1 class I SAM-dependent methyltransferase [Paludisphaera borealis]